MKKNIIIIGGGFAGLQLAQDLNHSDYSILLIDRQNHHQFQPLFYQVATARLEPSNISFPFRKVFQKSKNIEVCMASVKEILRGENKVLTDNGDFTYDHLV